MTQAMPAPQPAAPVVGTAHTARGCLGMLRMGAARSRRSPGTTAVSSRAVLGLLQETWTAISRRPDLQPCPQIVWLISALTRLLLQDMAALPCWWSCRTPCLKLLLISSSRPTASDQHRCLSVSPALPTHASVAVAVAVSTHGAVSYAAIGAKPMAILGLCCQVLLLLLIASGGPSSHMLLACSHQAGLNGVGAVLMHPSCIVGSLRWLLACPAWLCL